MDLKATLDIIIKDLNETGDIIDDLKNYPGAPTLQIELAKSKCRSAAEMIGLLKNLYDGRNIDKPANEVKTEVRPEPSTASRAPAPSGPPAERPVQRIVEDTDHHAHESKEITVNHVHETIIITDSTETKQTKLPSESPIIADQFTKVPESYNEALGNLKHDNDISGMLKSKPVSSITEAIGINDKFLFIREIFNGDLESYTNTIRMLESAGNLEDANSIIEGIAGEKAGSEAVKQLMDLIKRKFPSNE